MVPNTDALLYQFVANWRIIFMGRPLAAKRTIHMAAVVGLGGPSMATKFAIDGLGGPLAA